MPIEAINPQPTANASKINDLGRMRHLAAKRTIREAAQLANLTQSLHSSPALDCACTAFVVTIVSL
jgi:hypothetical protein